MTRAIDRLIVSGSIDPGAPPTRDADRLGARAARPEELEPRRDARSRSSATTRASSSGSTASGRRRRRRAERRPETRKSAAVAVRGRRGRPAADRGPALPRARAGACAARSRIRRLSYSALALFERCSYRFYAERIAGMRPAQRTGEGRAGAGRHRDGRCGPRAARADRPRGARRAGRLESFVRARYPIATDAELERIRGCRGVRRVGARPPGSGAPRREGGAAVRVRARRSALPRPHRRAARRRGSRPRHRLQDERAGRPRAGGRGRCGVPPPAARLRNRVPACRRRRSRGRAPVPGTRGRRRLCPLHRGDLPGLEAELSAAIARIQAGDFRPTPSEMVCSDCPVLGLVCAGPALRSYTSEPAPALAEA